MAERPLHATGQATSTDRKCHEFFKGIRLLSKRSAWVPVLATRGRRRGIRNLMDRRTIVGATLLPTRGSSLCERLAGLLTDVGSFCLYWAGG